MAAHHEIHLESYIVQKLVQNGWVEGQNSHYDPVRGLYPEDVVAWVKAANSQAWEKLERHNGASAENTLLDRLEKALGFNSGDRLEMFCPTAVRVVS
jgi:type I restriction enzyme R subunit